MNAIEVRDVSVRYNLERDRTTGLKEYVIKTLKREIRSDEFMALSHISFNVKKGELLGVVGPNGAGKTTLMRVIAGVFAPTYGSVVTRGHVVMLSLGVGFNNNLTAAENVYLSGAALGFSKAFMQERFDEIIDFAELNDFVDVPLRNFSSGMRSRLGFAVSTLVRPDILIIDEGLSAGDITFNHKANKRVNELLYSGCTVVMVSHAPGSIRSMCNTALLLHNGCMVEYGPIRK